jgi:hypothetical protein
MTNVLSNGKRSTRACTCAVLLLVACNSKQSADEELADGSVATGGGGAGQDEDTLDGGGRLSGNVGDGGTQRADGGFGRDASRPMQECPTSVPQNGSSCVSGRGDCMIGDTFCDCPSATSQWLCWKPSDCPSSAPAEQSACSVVGMECEIAGPDGGRGGLDCECTATGWDCGRQLCPASEPAAGGACEGGDGTCGFANGRICDCRSRQWVCWNQSDCPASSPPAGGACPVQRMLCDYASGECECGMQGWQCEGQSRPGDGGAPDAASLGDASTGDAGDAAAVPDA